MTIDFNKIEEQVLPNFKGGEKSFIAKMQNDGAVNIMYGKLQPGASIGLHTHEDTLEVLYVISGSGKVVTPDGEEPVSAGQCSYCPKGGTHSLVNDSFNNLLFFAAVPKV